MANTVNQPLTNAEFECIENFCFYFARYFCWLSVVQTADCKLNILYVENSGETVKECLRKTLPKLLL